MIARISSWLADRILEPSQRAGRSELTLILTDDDGITPINQAAFGKAGATDVISFAYPPRQRGCVAFMGEVVVNAERAWTLGPRHNGADRELALYIAHGIQHLTGASDHTAILRARMRRKERAWLNQAGKEGLLQGLCLGASA